MNFNRNMEKLISKRINGPAIAKYVEQNLTSTLNIAKKNSTK